MKVTCDRCKKEFDALLKEQTKQIDGQEIIKTYMECPYCKQQIIVCFDNQSTLVKKKQIRKQTQMLGTIKDENKYRRKLKDIEKRKSRLEREMKILKAKYSSEF